MLLISSPMSLAFQPAATTTTASTRATTTRLFAAPDDRRAFLVAVVATALGGSTVLAGPSPSLAASVDYKAVSADVAALVKANPDWGPTLVRLAWHSSGTYDKASQTGGSGGGTIRFASELAHGGNAGLASTAVEWLEPVYKKYSADGLSYADLYTLAGGAFSSMGSLLPVLWVARRLELIELTA